MADINKTINIDVNVENNNLDKTAQGMEKITKSTDAHTKSLEHNKKGVLENGGAMGLLGAATGGLAMDFKDAIEAIEMTGISLRGLRGAIIATGIGALAIILLELVTNWDKWIGVIDGSTAAMEKLTAQYEDLIFFKDREILTNERLAAISAARGESDEKQYEIAIKNSVALVKSLEAQIQVAAKLAAVEYDRNGNTEEYIKLQGEVTSLENEKYKAETAALTTFYKEETRVREKRLEDEKKLNDKLIAFIKNRSELNIKELQSLLAEFEKINDGVNALDAGKYGEIYDKLKTIFDLYKASQKNILESENKLEELNNQRQYAASAEQRQIDKKIDSLTKELKIKKEGFENIVNPQLNEEIKKIEVIANATIKSSYAQRNNYAKINDLRREEMTLTNKMAQDDSMRKKDLDFFVEKNEDINTLYKLRETIFRRSIEEEISGLEKTLNGYTNLAKELKANKGIFEEIVGVLKEANDQGMVDNIFSQEQIDKYQEKLNQLFGYRVDMNNLTTEEAQKIQNELFTIADKTLSTEVNIAQAGTELAKANSDARIGIAQITADKQVEISQNMYDKLTLQDEARIQHKQDMLSAEMGLAESAAGLLGVFAEDSKDLMRASIIADSAIGIGKMIISNNQANIGALATPQAILTSGVSAAPIIAMNNIATGLGIAANIAATAKALSKVGGGGADTGGAAAAAAPQAKFNIVGSSSSNQLAATIAQQQNQPVKAYVVGTDMTTQQALDRNIQKNATFL